MKSSARTPAGGGLLARGGTVTIQVSAGTEEIPVPDVRGQDLESARTFLESEGFTVESEFTFEFDDEIPLNSVVDTIPPAGTNLPPGGSIALVLSDGPEALFLPSWIGVDRDIALIEMEELGLIPIEFGVVTQNPSMWGRIIDTIPAPNTLVEPGIQVQIQVGIADPNAGQQPAGPGQPPVAVTPTPDPLFGGQGDGGQGDGFDG